MNDSTPKYVLLENYIKQAIKDKQLTDKLPGERALAKQLGMSYMTVRKGIDNLVEQGVLYRIPTRGTYVNPDQKLKKQTRTIGYFLDSSITSGISSPYYSMIFNALEKEASEHDYSLVYFSDISKNKMRSTLLKLDGVIATCFPRIEKTIELIKNTLPVVVIDNSAADKSIPSVIIDNFNADVQSAEHLCALGHQRIAFMTGLEDSDISSHRLSGYLHGLKKYGLKPNKQLIYKGDYSFKSGISGADYFLSLKEPPSAIICANDSMALGAIRKLDESGVRVPDDISIIGFDDIEIASQITPALTTVAAPVEQIANHAFAALHSLIQGKQPEFRHVTLSAELVIRETCTEMATTVVA